MKRFTLACCLVSLCHALEAQKTINAQILDSLNGQAVPFASIGLLDQYAGTLSNEAGQFTLIVEDSVRAAIKVSALGYETKILNTTDLQGKVLLPPLHTKEPVLVTASGGRTSRLKGNKVRNHFLSANIGDAYSEVAVRLHIDQPSTEVAAFFVKMAKGGSDSLPVFRINVYQPNLDGSPGPSLLRENIIVRPERWTELIEIDLRAYHLFADQDVYVSLQWLKDSGPKGYLLSAGLIGVQTWVRSGKKQKWVKSKILKPGLYARVVY